MTDQEYKSIIDELKKKNQKLEQENMTLRNSGLNILSELEELKAEKKVLLKLLKES